MALDADPSVIYAELLAGSYKGVLHHEDMFFKSAYNTYRNPGLPRADNEVRPRIARSSDPSQPVSVPIFRERL